MMPLKHLVLSAMLAHGLLLLRAASVSLRSDCGASMTFSEFVKEHGRAYEVGSEEYSRREELFTARVADIHTHNCQQLGLWRAGINHLTDRTEGELKRLLGHKSSRAYGHHPAMPGAMMLMEQQSYPSSFSWGNLSTVQETALNQGDCGSCWAIAAEGAMRSHAELKGREHKFSTEQLISCTPNPHKCGGEGGCNGATAELAYEYFLRQGTLPTNKAFIDAGGFKGGMKCPASQKVTTEVATEGRIDADGMEVHMLPDSAENMRGKSFGMVGWSKLPENKEAPIMRALLEQGPVYVAVAAGDGWFNYVGGVLQPSGCDKNNIINHAVLLYGYGIDPKTRIGAVKYWQIKNSWGEHWGEKGHVRLQRLDNEEGHCGWDTDPHEGTGCIGGPKKVWVCGSCGILYDGVVPHFAPL